MKISRALLVKFSRGECTKEEDLAIRDWLHNGSWPLLPEGEEIPKEIREKVWNKLQGRIRILPGKQHKIRKGYRGLLGMAAVLLALIGTVTLIYYNYYSDRPKPTTFIAGLNEYRKIVLPDSSVVFLSPGSSIKVLQPFNKDKRELSLTGEAVFEATHNADAPFKVISGNISTTALGTSFKVTSFRGKNEIQVALSYGKAVVKDRLQEGRGESLYLDPGEEIIYNKVTQSMHKKQAAPRQFDYKNDILYFKNAGVREVVEKLQRYYHIKVQYNALKQADWSVSGEFDYQPLSTVLKTIAYSCNMHYLLKKDSLILLPNN